MTQAIFLIPLNLDSKQLSLNANIDLNDVKIAESKEENSRKRITNQEAISILIWQHNKDGQGDQFVYIR